MRKVSKFFAAAFLLIALAVSVQAVPMGADFTYQGKLTDVSGNALSGLYNLSFKLYNALAGGQQIGSTVTMPGVSVSAGLFTVKLNFGTASFNGDKRWIETIVGTETMSPRVEITNVPSSINALTAVSVKSFGAVGNGSTDDTAAIQAAIDSVRTAGGIVFLPPGLYKITSLNLTDRNALIVEGSGQQATTLYCVATSGPAIDMTGAQYVTLRRLQVQLAPGSSPSTGLLVASGVNNNPSTSNTFDHVAISNPQGSFGVAAVVLYAAGDHVFDHCNFNVVNGKHALIATGINDYGLSSAFTTIFSGSSYTSDCTFLATEFHSDAPGGQATIVLRRTSQMRWFGGPCSNGSTAHFEIREGATLTVISGSTLYSETGTPAEYCIRVSDTNLVDGLTVDNANLQCGRAVFGGAAGASLKGVTVTGSVTVGGAPALMDFPPATNTSQVLLTNSLFMCGGKSIRPTGSISHTVLINPGAINLHSGASASDGVGKF